MYWQKSNNKEALCNNNLVDLRLKFGDKQIVTNLILNTPRRKQTGTIRVHGLICLCAPLLVVVPRNIHQTLNNLHSTYDKCYFNRRTQYFFQVWYVVNRIFWKLHKSIHSSKRLCAIVCAKENQFYHMIQVLLKTWFNWRPVCKFNQADPLLTFFRFW